MYSDYCRNLKNSHNSNSDIVETAFKKVCSRILEIVDRAINIKNLEILDNFQGDKSNLRPPISNWHDSIGLKQIQQITSALGMLLHLSFSSDQPLELINHRRPQKKISTYPTSPEVAKYLVEYNLNHLLGEQIPSTCKSVFEAERFAKKYLNFKVLDPSMESGCFLLQFGLSLIKIVHNFHKPNSREAYYLRRAMLERLCSECLWGLDINSRAIIASRTVFAMLAKMYEIPSLHLKNMHVKDSLEAFRAGEIGQFDSVVNNPPWGGSVDGNGRIQLRSFSTVHNRADAYIAFSELAIRTLRPGGVFGLILPSQMVGTQNCILLRKIFSAQTHINHIILLPRAAFADACVRGLVLLGRKKPIKLAFKNIQITRFPTTKRLNEQGPIKSHKIPSHQFNFLLGQPWTQIMNGNNLFLKSVPTIKLGTLADIICGIKMYGRGRGIPPQTEEIIKARPYSFSEFVPHTVPAVRGRDVTEYRVKTPTSFIRLGSSLAWIGPHESLLNRERIFIREICRRDGRIFAALAPNGIAPLHGVITIIPKNIDSYLLLAIMNSRLSAEYVRNHSASFTKVDFQRITIGELRNFPIPVSVVNGALLRSSESALSKHKKMILPRQLQETVRSLIIEAKKSDKYYWERREQLESTVRQIYGID